MRKDVREQIVPLLTKLKPQYTKDGYAKTLQEAFTKLKAGYVGIDTNAQFVASSFVGNTNEVNKSRFYNALGDAIGVNVQSVIQNEDIEDILVGVTSENVSLIKSIPEEYFKNIESIVYAGTTQGSQPSSMIKQIVNAGNTTTSRAKVIARDQTSKLNAALSQQRATNLGVEEYIWRTAGDGRVRPDHMSKNGKVFRYDSPPKDTGHPGHDIQCRCVAQPIIKVE